MSKFTFRVITFIWFYMIHSRNSSSTVIELQIETEGNNILSLWISIIIFCKHCDLLTKILCVLSFGTLFKYWIIKWCKKFWLRHMVSVTYPILRHQSGKLRIVVKLVVLLYTSEISGTKGWVSLDKLQFEIFENSSVEITNSNLLHSALIKMRYRGFLKWRHI